MTTTTSNTFRLQKTVSPTHIEWTEFLIQGDKAEYMSGCIYLDEDGTVILSDLFEGKICKDIQEARIEWARLSKDGYAQVAAAPLKPEKPASEIREALATDKDFQVKALLVLFGEQTASEQATKSTHDHNSRGFTAFDAEILSSFAEQWMSRSFLSPKQFAILAKKLPKYEKQIARLLA